MADGGLATSPVRLQKVEAVINPLAGGVGAAALAEMQDVLAGFGFSSNVTAVEPQGLSRALDAALSRSPDLLVVLAGDGTARAACELCGETGPLVIPLPGGTMNVLPKALYGARDWKTALTESLVAGVERPVSSGEIDGRRFYVATMLGWPALWARAREAVREHQLGKAALRARSAWRKAFTRKVAFSLDGGPEQRAHALTLLCPLVSKRMPDETALEAAALDPYGLTGALRVGVRVLVGDVFGDWREDPAVDMGKCRQARAYMRGELPAFIDGEPVRLKDDVRIYFRPKGFRALAPVTEDPRKI